MPEFPDYLYKYMSNSEHICGLLKDDEIYMSSVDDFNDPFEFDVKITQKRECLLETAKKEGRSKEDFEHEYKNNKKQTGKKFKEFYESNFKNMGVLSLTEDYKNLLMWAHYANCHKGLCVGFKASKFYRVDIDKKIGHELRKVKYNKYLPILPFKDAAKENTNIDLWKRLFCTKSKEWEYEQEWRVITANAFDIKKEMHSKKYPIPSDTIDKIYFGLKAEDRFIEEIRDAASGKKITFYKAEKSPTKYELIFLQTFP